MLPLLREHRQRRKVRVFRDKLMNSCISYLLRLFINFFFLSEQSQPLKSLRRLLHLSPSSSNQGQPPPPPAQDLRFQAPLPNPPQPSSKAGYSEGRGHGESRGHSGVSSSAQAKSRKPSYPLPGQIESSWHVSALQRAEGAQFTPEQLGIKPGQNGPTFTRASRTRMPNLNDLKETAL